MDASDFDWVTARLRAFPENALKELRDHCQRMVDVRNASLEGKNTGVTLELVQSENSDGFSISRSPVPDAYGRTHQAQVGLDSHRNRIQILDQSTGRSLDAAPYVTKNGRLRFKINDEGSYKLWQVARKALEPLFFERRAY